MLVRFNSIQFTNESIRRRSKMIRALTGETIKVGVVVNNPAVPPATPTPADLTHAVAKVRFKKVGSTDPALEKDAIIDIAESYVSGRLEGSETWVPGTYILEIRLWIDADEDVLTEEDADSILRETVRLKQSNFEEIEE